MLLLAPVCVKMARMPDQTLTRSYRGVTADDRVSGRREALIDAALEVFAAEGWSALSARRVCEQAGLTRRYFYESFADVDALLGAAFDRITGAVTDAVQAAAVGGGGASREELVRRAVSAGLGVLASPPSNGLFLAASLTAGGALVAHRARSIDDLATIVAAAVASQPDARRVSADEARLTARIAVSAILSIVDGWLTNEVKLTNEEVVSWSVTVAVGIIDAVTTRH